MASWIIEKHTGGEVELQIQGQASGVSCSLHTVSVQGSEFHKPNEQRKLVLLPKKIRTKPLESTALLPDL